MNKKTEEIFREPTKREIKKYRSKILGPDFVKEYYGSYYFFVMGVMVACTWFSARNFVVFLVAAFFIALGLATLNNARRLGRLNTTLKMGDYKVCRLALQEPYTDEKCEPREDGMVLRIEPIKGGRVYDIQDILSEEVGVDMIGNYKTIYKNKEANLIVINIEGEEKYFIGPLIY